MRRLFMLLVLLLPLSLPVAGCGGSGSKSGPAVEQSKKQMEEMMAKTQQAEIKKMPQK